MAAFLDTGGGGGATSSPTYNNKFNIVSDSRGAGGETSTSSGAYLRTNSFYAGIVAASNGKISISPFNVYAVSTYSTQDMLTIVQGAGTNAEGKTLWQAAVDDDCDNIIVLAGVNDEGADGLTLAQTKANYITMAEESLAAGKRLIVLNELPAETIYGTRLDNHYALHEWLNSPNGFTKNYTHIVVVDSFGAVAGATKNSFAPQMHLDQLHLNAIGNYEVGIAVGREIAQIVSDNYRFKLYNEQTTGNISVNPTLSGTGGTATASGTSGVVADGWKTQTQSVAGLSFVFSKETDANGITWQVVTVSGSPTDTSGTKFCSVLCDIDENDWPIGAEAAMSALVDWYDCVNIIGVTLDFIGSGDATIKARDMDGWNSVTDNRPLPASSKGARQRRTPLIARAADATPTSSGITAGVQIQVSTNGQSITGAYRSGNYVTLTTSAVHGMQEGQIITTSGLSADYNVTNGEIVAAGYTTDAWEIVGATRASNVVTATTTYRHRLIQGQRITVTGLSADYNATDVRVLSTPSPTTFTYTAAGANGTAGDQTGSVVHAGTIGTQLTYYSVGADGEAAANTGTISPPVSGVIKFALPTVRLRDTSVTDSVFF